MTKTQTIEDRAIKQLKWRDRTLAAIVFVAILALGLGVLALYDQGVQAKAVAKVAATNALQAKAQAATDGQILMNLNQQLHILQTATGPDATTRQTAVIQQVEHCIAVVGHLVAPDPTCAVGTSLPRTTTTTQVPPKVTSAPATTRVPLTTSTTTRATTTTIPCNSGGISAVLCRLGL